MKTAIELLRVELILNSKQKHTESGKTSFTIGLSKFDELFKEAEKNHKQQMIKIADHCLSTVKIIDKKSGFVAMAAEQYYWENFNN